jgi:hypothetical protein
VMRAGVAANRRSRPIGFSSVGRSTWSRLKTSVVRAPVPPLGMEGAQKRMLGTE